MHLTEENKQNIVKAIKEGGKIWENDLLAEVKQKIKLFCRDRQGEQCCYCRRYTIGEFKMVLDIEHVLPKSKFKHYMFNLNNLSCSCKRCNMDKKKEDISFYLGSINSPDLDFKSETYQLIHPNIDNYYDHIDYYVSIVNEKMLVKYFVKNNSQKGGYTFCYFKLNELEVDTFNQAQGIVESESINELIDSETADRIEALLK